MEAFRDASNFVINNSVFVHQNTNIQSGRNGVDILRESSAQEAAFDSIARQYAPSCFPGTRSQYIEDIVNWGITQSGLPMYLMTGPAGVGKSAIAQTCAEELRHQGQLGASFFFTTLGCNDHSYLFRTIAYQLSTEFAGYHEHLNKKLYSDPTLVDKQLRSQFRELIGEPFRELIQAGKQVSSRVILIDGLDECKDKEAQREIIEIVAASIQARTTPFYWAFFSRPESQIQAAFADPGVASICNSIFLPISRGIDGEIELYLRTGLENALRRRMITISVPWPSEQDMSDLLSATQGLFIYAATILRFVEQRNTLHDPQELLRMVLKSFSPGHNGGSTRMPFEALDDFYRLILQRIPDELHSSIQLLLSFMVFDTLDSSSPVGIRVLSNALRLTEVKVKMLCGELVAVIYRRPSKFATNQGLASHTEATSSQLTPAMQMSLKDEMYGREEWLTFYHKSFFDFLCTPARSGPFCVFSKTTRNMLFQRLLDVETGSLQGDLSQQTAYLDGQISDRSASEIPNDFSWPFDTDKMNLNLGSLVSEHTGGILLDGFFPYDDFDAQSLQRLGDMDHRKYLLTRSQVFAPNTRVSCATFGFTCSMKNVEGTMLSSTSRLDMRKFDVVKFRTGISRLEEAEVIRRHEPSSTTLQLPLFRYDSNGDLLSGLYTKGRGQKSSFWYLYLDAEMRYYRDFESVELAEGEKIFREEDFQAWSDGHRVEISEQAEHGIASSSSDHSLLDEPVPTNNLFRRAYSFCTSILFCMCSRRQAG